MNQPIGSLSWAVVFNRRILNEMRFLVEGMLVSHLSEWISEAVHLAGNQEFAISPSILVQPCSSVVFFNKNSSLVSMACALDSAVLFNSYSLFSNKPHGLRRESCCYSHLNHSTRSILFFILITYA